MISHLVGALEMESTGSGGAGYAQLLDDRLVLSPLQELKINHDLPTRASDVIIGTTGFSKGTHILYTAAAAMTPAATRHNGPEFEREHPLHLSVSIASTGDERDE